ncbi:MAG: DUF2142 domain-containing protein [Acidimicrobiia bacterium]
MGGKMARLASSARAVRPRIPMWWCAFFVFAAIGIAWSWTTPPFTQQDEASQINYATAVGGGHFIAKEELEVPTGPPTYPTRQRIAVMEVPVTFDSDWTCFISDPTRSADCAGPLTARSSEHEQPSYHSRYPPLYYALVGWPASVISGPRSYDAMRLVSALIVAAFLASALRSAIEGRRSRVMALGVLVAATPGVFFVAGGIQSSGFEIAAAVCLWTTLLVLAAERDAAADVDRRKRLITRASVAAVALMLARPFSPMWVLLIVGVVAVLARRDLLVELARIRRARVALGVVLVAGAVAATWFFVRDPGRNFVRYAEDVPRSGRVAAARLVFGQFGDRLVDMIGHFGWPDDLAASTLTIACWILALGVLAGCALMVAPWRSRLVLATLVGLVVLIPPIVVASGANTFVPTGWVGRYDLPLAVGVPLVGAFLLDRHRGEIGSFAARGATLVAIAVGVGQIAAYVTVAHRFVVGTAGPILYFLHVRWSPKLSAGVLLLVIVVSCTLLAWWTRRAVDDTGPFVHGIELSRRGFVAALTGRTAGDADETVTRASS